MARGRLLGFCVGAEPLMSSCASEKGDCLRGVAPSKEIKLNCLPEKFRPIEGGKKGLAFSGRSIDTRVGGRFSRYGRELRALLYRGPKGLWCLRKT